MGNGNMKSGLMQFAMIIAMAAVIYFGPSLLFVAFFSKEPSLVMAFAALNRVVFLFVFATILMVIYLVYFIGYIRKGTYPMGFKSIKSIVFKVFGAIAYIFVFVLTVFAVTNVVKDLTNDPVIYESVRIVEIINSDKGYGNVELVIDGETKQMQLYYIEDSPLVVAKEYRVYYYGHSDIYVAVENLTGA